MFFVCTAPSASFLAGSVQLVSTARTISLSLLPPRVVDRNGQILEYRIFYQRKETNEQVHVGDEQNVTVSVVEQEARVSVNLTSLEEFSNYMFSVEACNSEGCSQRSTAGNITTDQSCKWHSFLVVHTPCFFAYKWPGKSCYIYLYLVKFPHNF